MSFPVKPEGETDVPWRAAIIFNEVYRVPTIFGDVGENNSLKRVVSRWLRVGHRPALLSMANATLSPKPSCLCVDENLALANRSV
jgi:hypothetical protein